MIKKFVMMAVVLLLSTMAAAAHAQNYRYVTVAWTAYPSPLPWALANVNLPPGLATGVFRLDGPYDYQWSYFDPMGDGFAMHWYGNFYVPSYTAWYARANATPWMTVVGSDGYIYYVRLTAQPGTMTNGSSTWQAYDDHDATVYMYLEWFGGS